MWIRIALLTLVLPGLVWAQQSKEDKKKADEEAKTRLADFKKDLRKCKTGEDVGRAIAILGQFQHPKIFAELKKWLRNRSVDVAEVAAEMIGKYENDRAAAELLAATALSHKDPNMIVTCLRRLAEVRYRAIAPKLLKLFRNHKVEVAREAVDTCGALKSKAAMDALIKLAKELDGVQDKSDLNTFGGAGGVENEQVTRKRALEGPVQSALEDITGQKHKDVRSWDSWWRKNRRSFKELELDPK